MSILPQNFRYLPHDLSTRYHAVKLYRTGANIQFVIRRYKISKASLMRWNKRFDGTRESLASGSHRPHTPHPHAHTEAELKSIRDLLRRNPSISLCELYGKLRRKYSYQRHPASLFRVMRKLGIRPSPPPKSSKYRPKPYDTPTKLGVKWQMDVKYIPTRCYSGTIPQKFYQYTVVEEASRERFLFPYLEYSSYSSVDFLRRAIQYFGYSPEIVQTDNGTEFTHLKDTPLVHPFDKECLCLGISHHRIRPRTPRHNGKVERSHRNDNERFYAFLQFYDFQDLHRQMAAYLRRSNQIPMQVLGWKSPVEKRQELWPSSFPV